MTVSRRKLNVFRSFAFSSSLFSVFQNLGERLGHSFAYDSETMSQNGVRHRRIDVTSTEVDQGHAVGLYTRLLTRNTVALIRQRHG